MNTCLPLIVALSFGLCSLAASEKEPFEVMTASAEDFGIFGRAHLYCFRGGRIELEDAKQLVRRIIVAGNEVPRNGRFVLDAYFFEDADELDPFAFDALDPFALDALEAEEGEEEPREVIVFYSAKTQKLKLCEIKVVERSAKRLIFSIDADVDATKLFDVLERLAKTHFGDKKLAVEAVPMRKNHYAVKLFEAS